jgi:hypothetical protein
VPLEGPLASSRQPAPAAGDGDDLARAIGAWRSLPADVQAVLWPALRLDVQAHIHVDAQLQTP